MYAARQRHGGKGKPNSQGDPEGNRAAQGAMGHAAEQADNGRQQMPAEERSWLRHDPARHTKQDRDALPLADGESGVEGEGHPGDEFGFVCSSSYSVKFNGH